MRLVAAVDLTFVDHQRSTKNTLEVWKISIAMVLE